MSKTIMQFVRDMQATLKSYSARVDFEIGRGEAHPGLFELCRIILTSDRQLRRALTLAKMCDDSLALQNQTLGIIQEAEAGFNEVRDAEDLVIKVRHFHALTNRLVDLLN